MYILFTKNVNHSLIKQQIYFPVVCNFFAQVFYYFIIKDFTKV